MCVGREFMRMDLINKQNKAYQNHVHIQWLIAYSIMTKSGETAG